MLVKIKVGVSKIEGLGVFADQFIPKGAKTWEFTPGFDSEFTPEQVKEIPKLIQEFLGIYSYVSNRTGNYILPSDNERFTNHSDNPNIASVHVPDGEDYDIAIRDIQKWEEITADYRLAANPIDFEVK